MYRVMAFYLYSAELSTELRFVVFYSLTYRSNTITSIVIVR